MSDGVMPFEHAAIHTQCPRPVALFGTLAQQPVVARAQVRVVREKVALLVDLPSESSIEYYDTRHFQKIVI